jgi:uncharacterized protein (DUF1501 family)
VGWLGRTALAAAAQPDAADTILVVVQLAGGNDGLNTVVPYGDDHYAKNRLTLRLPEGQLHKIDSLVGFHPVMQPLMRLFQEGYLSVIQGVGYPNQNQSHGTSMRIWQTAGTEADNRQAGWLGRVVDQVWPAEESGVPAVFVGHINQPFSLHAEKTIIPSLRWLGQWTLHAAPGPPGQAHRRRLEQAAALPRGGDNPMLGFVQRNAQAAYALSRQVEAVQARPGGGTAEYPPLQLAGQLRTIAQLIRAEVGIRIYQTELGGEEPGGFDNHANQRDNHAALLGQLSQSVAAFVDDLKRDKLLDRVLLMTYSEFGRTVRENGRRGTDHGAAAPLFLVGGKVKGGLLGPHPQLTDLQGGGLRFHTDFRRVYATVLERWLGFNSRAVLGGRFEPLDVLQG